MRRVGVLGSARWVASFGNRTMSQGMSQMSEHPPNTRNVPRQPTMSIKSPARNTPTPGPIRYPNATMPFAMPSPFTGTTAASSFDTVGNPTLSPSPSIMRSAINIEKPEVTPVSAVAVAHTTRPAVSTRWAPYRSASAPTGIWMSA